MFSYRTTANCPACGDIESLLGDIDCELKSMAVSLYNNLVFALNKKINTAAISDLIHYRRILRFKLVNSEYASEYTVAMIANKINLLKFKN